MSKADTLKEEIGWLKVAFGVAVALDASLVAWLAENYAVANLVLVGTGLVVTLGLATIILIINRRAYRRMKELEDV